ncbi:hypothetical protein AB0I72_24660 [Nocardiopsis sp. NPDC049922]|uniref:hypothetical protein n=1 Tax=Nocardiopsis sp. NPDC049922 TaxID=3155157 RepID=UPI003404C792
MPRAHLRVESPLGVPGPAPELIVGDRQVESLAENVDLTGESGIVFVKPIPPAGG